MNQQLPDAHDRTNRFCSFDTKRCRAIVLLLGLPLVGFGCAGDSSDEDEPGLVGPCIHMLQDEVLHIDDASGSSAGAVIGQLELTSFQVNDQARTSEEVVAQRQSNVVLDDDIVRCTLPCSFGTEPGLWEFTAMAPGYAPTEQSTMAEYATFSGGCPSFETDGTHISAVLDEAGN